MLLLTKMLGTIIKSGLSMALPWWVKPLAVTFVIVSWSGFCYVKGIQRVEARWEAEQLASKLTQAIEYKRVETVLERVVYQYVPQIRVIEKQGREIVKKVPVYVPQEASDRCVINNGFVWLHEKARSGLSIPHDPARIADPAPGIGLADVGKTITVNYTKFRKMKTQCQALLEIVSSLPQEKR